MAFVEEYITSVRQLTRDRFVSKNPQVFLLCSNAREVKDQKWNFRTQTITSAKVSLAKLMADGWTISRELLKYEIFPVVKAHRNPWRDHVSVGRARNNDIVIADESVSKLHAHFNIGGDGSMSIQDAGSRNGTLVNTTKLVTGVVVPLASGDRVAFGRIEMLLLDAGALYDFIANHIQPTSP